MSKLKTFHFTCPHCEHNQDVDIESSNDEGLHDIKKIFNCDVCKAEIKLRLIVGQKKVINYGFIRI